MKKITRLLALAAFVLSFSPAVFSQNQKEWKKYESRTLAKISQINGETTDEILRKAKLEEKHDFISYNFFHSRVKVEFTGQQRPVSPDHQDLIKLWSKLHNIGKKATSLYENEFLFKEADREFWIPVQKKVEEAMLKELKPNDMMTLFVIHVGGRKAAMAKEFDWLFLSTAYEK